MTGRIQPIRAVFVWDEPINGRYQSFQIPEAQVLMFSCIGSCVGKYMTFSLQLVPSPMLFKNWNHVLKGFKQHSYDRRRAENQYELFQSNYVV